MESFLGATPTQQVPDDWQTFYSKLGLFTVRIPPDWRIEGGTDEGISRIGGPEGMLTSLHEGYHFMESNDFYAFIEAFAIKTDYDRKTYAARVWPYTWHGYPACSRRGRGWFFLAADAYFGTGYHPIPPSLEQHEILDLIFASFAPTNPSLLVAPD